MLFLCLKVSNVCRAREKNVEIYDYVKSFEKFEFSTDGTIIFNLIVTDLYLCLKGVQQHFGKLNLVIKILITQKVYAMVSLLCLLITYVDK